MNAPLRDGATNIIVTYEFSMLNAKTFPVVNRTLRFSHRKHFKVLTLCHVPRQNDPVFQNLLQNVRLGNNVDSIPCSQLLECNSLDQIYIDGPTIICSGRRERINDVGSSISDREKACLKTHHPERRPDSLELKVGAPLVLTKNIDLECGWINGTMATAKVYQGCITIRKIKKGRKIVIMRMNQNITFPGRTHTWCTSSSRSSLDGRTGSRE